METVNDPDRIEQIDETRVGIMDQLNQAVQQLEKQTSKPTVAEKIKGWRKEAVTP